MYSNNLEGSKEEESFPVFLLLCIQTHVVCIQDINKLSNAVVTDDPYISVTYELTGFLVLVKHVLCRLAVTLRHDFIPELRLKGKAPQNSWNWAVWRVGPRAVLPVFKGSDEFMFNISIYATNYKNDVVRTDWFHFLFTRNSVKMLMWLRDSIILDFYSFII